MVSRGNAIIMDYIITQISQAKKNTERVNIYLNDKFWLGLSKNNLVSLKLVKGKELSELEKHDIESAAQNSNLITRALNYISARPRSIAEVRDYLVLKKEVPEEDAENAIAYLEDHEYLSDKKFTSWYIDYKSRNGVNGINKIKNELLKKKVSSKVISKVLEKFTADEEFRTNESLKIQDYAKKVMSSIKAKDAYEFRAKLTQKLMARGFKYDDIKNVVKNLS